MDGTSKEPKRQCHVDLRFSSNARKIVDPPFVERLVEGKTIHVVPCSKDFQVLIFGVQKSTDFCIKSGYCVSRGVFLYIPCEPSKLSIKTEKLHEEASVYTTIINSKQR